MVSSVSVGGVWCGVCVVQTIKTHAVSVQGRAYMQLIGWQNAWEQAPRRPRHPFPALMAGVNPGHVLVYTALKKLTIAMMSSTTHDVANTGTSTSLSKKQDPGT